jgi:hypothetical protein
MRWGLGWRLSNTDGFRLYLGYPLGKAHRNAHWRRRAEEQDITRELLPLLLRLGRRCASAPKPLTSALSAFKFRQHRYVSVNISLIPLAETGINASLAADVNR